MFPIKNVLSFMEYSWQAYYRRICRETYNSKQHGIYQQQLVNGHLFSYIDSECSDEYNDSTEITWLLEGSPDHKKYVTFNKSWPYLSVHVSLSDDDYMAVIRWRNYDVYTYSGTMVDPNMLINTKNGIVFSYKCHGYSLSYLSDEDLAEERCCDRHDFVKIDTIDDTLRLCAICEYPGEVQICFDPVAKKIDHIFVKATDYMIFYWSKDIFRDTVDIDLRNNYVAKVTESCPFDMLIWDLIMSFVEYDDLRTCCKTSVDVWNAATKYINNINCSWVIHDGRSIASCAKDMFGYYDTIAGCDYFFGHFENDTRVNLEGFEVCGNYLGAVKLWCNDIYGSPVIQKIDPVFEQKIEFFKDLTIGKTIKVTYENDSMVDFEMLKNDIVGSFRETCNIFIVPNMMELFTTGPNQCRTLVKFADDGTIESVLAHLRCKHLRRNIYFVGFKNE